MASRTSATPPLPRPKMSTSFLEKYFSRSLLARRKRKSIVSGGSGALARRRRRRRRRTSQTDTSSAGQRDSEELKMWTHHPPGSTEVA